MFLRLWWGAAESHAGLAVPGQLTGVAHIAAPARQSACGSHTSEVGRDVQRTTQQPPVRDRGPLDLSVQPAVVPGSERCSGLR